MIYLILLYIVLALIDVSIHYYRIEILGHLILHRKETIVSAITYLSSSYFVAYMLNIELPVLYASWLIAPGLRWIIHDLALNFLRGKDLNYYGDGKQDAKTDILLKKIKINPLIFKGIVLIILSIISFVITKL